MSPSRQCVELGRCEKKIRSGMPALEAWRGGRANRSPRHLTASGAVPVCGAPLLVENIVKISRRSVGGFAFVVHVEKTHRAASHCPFLNATLLMLPRFRLVACGLNCVEFDAEIVARFRLVQRLYDPQTPHALLPRTEHMMQIFTDHIT